MVAIPPDLAGGSSRPIPRLRRRAAQLPVRRDAGRRQNDLRPRCCARVLRTRRAQRVIVVCPSDYLKKQLTRAASAAGIELDCNWTTGRLAPDFQGVIVTYQAVASNPHAIRLLTSVPTVAFFDEIHHAGDTKAWGDSLRYAFDRAVFRLALSGTPFRSDSNAIPFVRYERGESVADFSYGYGQALEDDVCRPVFFPRWDGQMEWMSGADIVSATFADELDEQAARERLRTAITSEDWLRRC